MCPFGSNCMDSQNKKCVLIGTFHGPRSCRLLGYRHWPVCHLQRKWKNPRFALLELDILEQMLVFTFLVKSLILSMR